MIIIKVMMYKRGLVTLSADPIHNGHIDLITSAKMGCEKLFVLVTDNDEKKNTYLFSKRERIDFVRCALKKMDGVEVIESDKILPDIYLMFGCDALFRGIRNEEDAKFETTQMSYHRRINDKINPVYLQFRHVQYVSSTIVKSFVGHHIDVSDYVPIFVKKALEEKINHQYKIAVTGGLAVGKSWTVDNLLHKINVGLRRYRSLFDPNVYAPCFEQQFAAHIIRFDDLIRSVYDDPQIGPTEMRKQLDSLCLEAGSSRSILNDNGTINGSILSKFVFPDNNYNSDLKFQLQELTQPFVDVKYREALKKAGPGIVLVEWAQLGEMQVSHWTNNNVIVVDSPDRSSFLEKRGISLEDFTNKTKFQLTTEQKVNLLESIAGLDRCGHIIQFSNTILDNKIDDLVKEIMVLFKVLEV